MRVKAMTSIYEIHKANRIGRANDFWTALVAQKWKASEEEFKEYTGSVPVTINANGSPLISWSIYGNTVQNGTPTPQNPVSVNGVGKISSNLADLYGVSKRDLSLDFTTTDNMRIVIDGTKSSGANVISIKTPNIVVPAGRYTVKLKMTGGTITGVADGVFFGINRSTYGQRTTPAVAQVGDVGTRTFTLSEDTTISSFDIAPGYGSVGGVFDNATFECWFYAGSDDNPYEPYGYKIPISSASTTTPIYLGEVETTRKVKKLVLTGEESGWTKNTSVSENNAYYRAISGYYRYNGLCSHYVTVDSVRAETGIFFGSNINFLTKLSDEIDTVDKWKSYLQQRYTNGTPVCVWYVLATEEKAVVNEPLMKIGTYADEVSNVATIPTVNGSNTFDVETTVKPSEVYIKYKGR